MINDETIDLTVDSKFTNTFTNGLQSWPHYYNENRVKLKLFKNNSFDITLTAPWMIKLQLPWNRKPVPNGVRINYWKKDPVSFQLQATVRTTSDNNWFLNNQLNPNVIEDYFIDEFASVPFQSIKYCLSCSNKKITTIKNSVRIGYCRDCNQNIPWQNKPVATIRPF